MTTTKYVLSFVALLLLTAATFGLSFVHLGALEIPVALGIAAAKSAIVAFYFMHLIEQPSSHRIAASAGVVFIAIVVTLTSLDVLTRS
ncbi:MAG: cytochrome C oxidase subunit IV family protein [Myxococcales bacterium]|nr:cytochrome C oxidase subunit IV family protein [Myxococcales bacterium]MCB9579258.1 cytochrome C oxidase subunit IV family protein [Polyangiaceae bacterium]